MHIVVDKAGVFTVIYEYESKLGFLEKGGAAAAVRGGGGTGPGEENAFRLPLDGVSVRGRGGCWLSWWECFM